MDDADALTAAWVRAAAALPPGWTLDSLRCASTGLSPEDQSADWIAVATGPGGDERRHQAGDAIAALAGLIAGLSLS